MVDPAVASLSADAALKSLELLFDYTKFHIGVYLTLAASYITIATSDIGPTVKRCPAYIATLLFALAGLAGGVITSSITQCECGSSAVFLKQQIGPWAFDALTMEALYWTWVEHTAFWAGLAVALFSLKWPAQQGAPADRLASALLRQDGG
jgi:hypothetical protein